MASRGMANARHKKIVKMAKGYRGRANRCFTVALHRVNKAKQYAYRDRKVQKRNARTLWIQRINAGVRLHGMKYNHFINRLHLGNVQLNRKVLADIAVTEPLSFKSVVEVAKV
jgi:large subunit ribosomal protein L20